MKCPLCSGTMKSIVDSIKQDNISFEAFKCEQCSEELVNMNQLKELATKYHELRKAKEITFVKWGNSLAIRIPQQFVKGLDIKEGDHAILKKTKEGLELISI